MSVIEQNKNYGVIFHRVFAFLTAFVLCIMLLPVSSLFVAFADTDSFDDMPLPMYSGSGSPDAATIRSDGFLFYTLGLDICGLASRDDIYAFLYVGSSSSQICFLHDSANAGYGNVWVTTSGNLSNVDSTTLGSSDSTYQFTYGLKPINSGGNPVNLVSFSSLADGFSAVRDYIDNGGSSDDLHELNLTLQPGNIAYIDISGAPSGNFARVYESYSDFEDTSSRPSYTRYGYASSIPSSISFDSISDNIGSNFTVSGYGQMNVFGGFKTYDQIVNLSSGNNYVWFYCPLSRSAEVYHYASTIYVARARSVRIIPVSTVFNGAGAGTILVEGDSSTQNLFGTYDPDSNTWSYVNVDGDPASQVDGGLTSSIMQSGEYSINDWLQNIAHTISGFFNGAIGAVTTLVNAATDFFNSVSGLYTWLPTPVYSVLISALIIAVTIGVIKVFI